MATNWRDIGDTTLAAFKDEIRKRAPSSPLLAEADAIHAAASPHTRLLLGMCWMEDRYQTDPSDNFPLSFHNFMNMKTPDGSGWMQFDSYAAAAKGWRERITSPTYKNGIYANTETVAELVHVYAPSSDNNDEADYVRTIGIIVDGLPNLPDQTDQSDQSDPGGNTGMGVNIGNRPLRIAVGAGHHDTARGNPYETELNGRKANALIKELRKRGHDVYSTHPDDGLGYANVDYNGVARALVTHVNATGWKPDYFIECHSEGSSPGKCGSFILYPDNGNDVDVDLRDAGGVFAQKLKERTGIGICTILTTSPGVSSETQSGVGLDGFRLGVFANTASLNPYCTRLIFEAGAHTCPHDKAIMDRADFPQLHALATADALEAFAKTRLGWTGTTATTTTTTTPAPTPPPAVEYAPRITTGFTGKDGTVTRKVTIKTGAKDAKGKAITEDVDVVYDVYVIERPFEVIHKTKRRQGPDSRGPIVGPPLEVRETFMSEALCVPRKQPGKNIPMTQFVTSEQITWVQANHLTPRVSIRKA